MRIRMHRGGLAESMQTAVCIDNSMTEIRAYLSDHGLELRNSDLVDIAWYGYDSRIDWPLFGVSVNGDMVAFTDERLHDDKERK